MFLRTPDQIHILPKEKRFTNILTIDLAIRRRGISLDKVYVEFWEKFWIFPFIIFKAFGLNYK